MGWAQIAAMAAQSAGSLFSLGSGLIQNGRANRLESINPRPIYYTPGEVYQNQKLAQQAAQNGMNATEYNNQLNDITGNEAAGLNSLRLGRNTLAGVGNLVAQSNAADGNLNAQDASIKRMALAAYMNANQNVADYTDKGFQYNQADRYAEVMNKISQMRAMANKNISQGVQGLTNGAQSMFQNMGGVK